MYIQLKAIAFCANMDYAFVETYFVNGAFLFVYYLILILLYRKKSGNYIKRLVIVILLILNFYVYMNIAESTDKARITYINTGISNSTLIKMPGGTNIMINPGGSKDKNYSAQRSIIPYLKTERIDCIDILVINSLNINEYKNLVYLINNFSIKKLILPVYYKPIFLNNSDIKNLRIDYIDSSTIINKQGNFRIYVYYNPYLKGESMMSEFVYGQQSFIFSDSRNITDDLINSAYMPEENALMVLKASGSGSFNFNSADFTAKADPEFIVISSSDRGRKKADSEIFNKSLNEAGYTVLNTSDEGAVIFETDGFETKRVLWR
jgi:competence protein ComEC